VPLRPPRPCQYAAAESAHRRSQIAAVPAPARWLMLAFETPPLAPLRRAAVPALELLYATPSLAWLVAIAPLVGAVCLVAFRSVQVRGGARAGDGRARGRRRGKAGPREAPPHLCAAPRSRAQAGIAPAQGKAERGRGAAAAVAEVVASEGEEDEEEEEEEEEEEAEPEEQGEEGAGSEGGAGAAPAALRRRNRRA
jgi:hypothetical protein